MGAVAHTDAHWVGVLSASVGLYLSGRIDEKALRGYYRDFLRSPVCDAGTRQHLPDLPAKPPTRGK